MITELINTGTELMLGRVLNTHQQWLCGELADLGYVVNRQVAVPDTAADIQMAVRESLARADLVIVTGGLGPTSDDLTRELVAALVERPLREHPAALAHIEGFFAARSRAMPDRARVQAMVPEGALVLENSNGTAPGLAIEVRPNRFRADGRRSWLIMLPGPPRELRPMFSAVVVPLLRRVLPLDTTFVCLTLRSTGIPESLVEERVAPRLETLFASGVQVGYCARPGQVDVRLTASGPHAAELVRQAGEIAHAELAASIYTTRNEEIEEVIVRLLTERRQTLALAESCTGGCVGHRLTNVPGVSASLLADLVTYSNQAKQKFLEVDSNLLATYGAVSEPVARQMAEGVLKQTGADYGLSLTGIAGPGGAAPGKPVGTLFVGLATSAGTKVEHHFNPWDRLTFKQAASQQALDLLRRSILGLA